MKTQSEELLIEKLKALPPEQRAEVEDFIDFLAGRAKKKEALDRLLTIAPTLERAGVAPMTEQEIGEEVKAAREERRARNVSSRADRS
jgi:hypothetical protein